MARRHGHGIALGLRAWDRKECVNCRYLFTSSAALLTVGSELPGYPICGIAIQSLRYILISRPFIIQEKQYSPRDLNLSAMGVSTAADMLNLPSPQVPPTSPHKYTPSHLLPHPAHNRSSLPHHPPPESAERKSRDPVFESPAEKNGNAPASVPCGRPPLAALAACVLDVL